MQLKRRKTRKKEKKEHVSSITSDIKANSSARSRAAEKATRTPRYFRNPPPPPSPRRYTPKAAGDLSASLGITGAMPSLHVIWNSKGKLCEDKAGGRDRSIRQVPWAAGRAPNTRCIGRPAISRRGLSVEQGLKMHRTDSAVFVFLLWCW